VSQKQALVRAMGGKELSRNQVLNEGTECGLWVPHCLYVAWRTGMTNLILLGS
jgi:hypothetical protein